MGGKTTCPDCGYAFDSQTLEPGLEGLCPKCLAGVAKSDTKALDPGGASKESASTKETVYSPLRLGATFRGLEILGHLGRGGMGVVYKARQTNLDRTVALKVLAPQYAASPEFIQRFEREAKILASVNHANVTQVHDFGRENDLLFLVLEYVEGQDLETIFNRGKAINTARFLQVMREVTKALEAVHGAGLVHRDIKPANILLTKKGITKLTDFGLAVDTEDKQKLTESGFFVGTPHYVSPEHVQGKKIDGRSDLYSLGVIIYQGIAGRPPFNAASNTALLMMHVQEPPPPLYKYAPNAPKEVGEIVRKLLAKNPASRHDSAGALLKDLDRAIEAAKAQVGTKRVEAGDFRILESSDDPPKTKRASAAVPEKKLPWKLIGGAAATAVVVIAALVFLFGGSSEEPKRSDPLARTTKEATPPRPAPNSPVEEETDPAPKPVVPKPMTPPVAPPPKPKSAPPKAAPPKDEDPNSKILDRALKEGDLLFAEARKKYDEGKSQKSASQLTQAAFKAEQARIKYQAVVELGEGPTKEKARLQIRAVQQLIKLASEAKLAVARPTAAPPAPPPSAAPPKRAPEVKEGEKPADPAPPPPVKEPDLPAAKKESRLAVPEDSAQDKARKLIRTLFKAEYSDKSPAAKQTLAQKLLEKGLIVTNDPVSQWVFLNEALDIAAAGGDVETAFAAADEVAKSFLVERLDLKYAVLTKLKVAVRDPWMSRDLALACVEIAKEAVFAERYDTARKALQRGQLYARAAKDVYLLPKTRALQKDVSSLKLEFTRVKAKLENPAPKDEEAVGRYLCFVLGDWQRGLPHLLAGARGSLKKVVSKEEPKPTEVGAQEALAKAWVDFGRRERSSWRRKQILNRARHWLTTALPKATGVTRLRLVKRLADLEEDELGVVDLLPMIDPKKDTVSGDWVFKDGALACSYGAKIRIEIPYTPPDEYDLEVTVEKRTGNGTVGLGLVRGNLPFGLWIDGQQQYGTCLSRLADIDNLPDKFTDTLIAPSQPSEVVVSVRNGGVSVTIDGKRVIKWTGKWSRMSPCPTWRGRRDNVLILGGWNNVVAFTKVRLILISAPGKQLRR